VTEPNPRPQHPACTSRCRAIRRHAQRRHFSFYSRCDHWTFLQNVAAAPISWRGEHWVLGSVAFVLTLLAGVIMPTWASAMRTEPEPAAHTTLTLPLPQIAEADPAIGAFGNPDLGPQWTIVEVRAGQTLSDIFNAQGIGSSELYRALQAAGDGSALRRIHPGDEFAFAFDANHALEAMRFDHGDAVRVTLHFGPDGVTRTDEDRAVERRMRVAHGVVGSSLFEAGEQAGMSDAMVLKLAKAFGYDIDFAQDLRRGDSFSVIYDDLYREGERIKGGDIIAATFINQGKRYSAIRYTNANGETLYYSADGRPLRTAFLRTPVEFTRISSIFTSGRRHPILGKMRAHRGVDYAAPTGTPIHAAGAGKVVFRGKQRGYGNVVILKHGGKYSTLYGHMSRFAKIHVGQSIDQGQVIGYVGMTGLATGPHLHYEFRVNGVHKDPLKVTLPKQEPLPPSQFAKFQLTATPLLAKLKMVDDIRLARAD
jgi:murein DD-endopeptidase MepM/ murein hydrolase activator NlpD